MATTSWTDGAEFEYDERRRRAFLLAGEGRRDEALAQLTEGWTDGRPDPTAYLADVARVRYLAGDYEQALGALDIGRGGVGPELMPIAVDCVRRNPRLRRAALRIVVRRGSLRNRGRAAWAVLRAR